MIKLISIILLLYFCCFKSTLSYKPLDCRKLSLKQCLLESSSCSPSHGDKCCDDEPVFQCIPSEHCDPMDEPPESRIWCVDGKRHSYIRYNSTCFSYPDREFFLPNTGDCSESSCPTGYTCRDYDVKLDHTDCHRTSDNECCSFKSKCVPRDKTARPSLKPVSLAPPTSPPTSPPASSKIGLKSDASIKGSLYTGRPPTTYTIEPVTSFVERSVVEESDTNCGCPDGTSCIMVRGSPKCIPSTASATTGGSIPLPNIGPSRRPVTPSPRPPTPTSLPTCASMQCVKGMECVDNPIYGARCRLVPKPKPSPTPEPVPKATCASTECVWGWKCVDNAETGARCIPPPTRPSCEYINCWAGYICVSDDLDGGHCVPKTNCTTVKCGPGQHCIDERETNTPKCVSNSEIVSCSQIRCKSSYECVENGQSGGRCVPVVTCDRVKCAAYFKCENGASGAECVPMPNCTTVAAKCPKGTYCEDDPSLGGHCRNVSRITCAVVDCSDGFHCVEGVGGREPTCVSNSKVTCSTVRCRAGFHCVEGAYGPECVTNPTCAESQCGVGTYCVDDPTYGAICKNATKLVQSCDTIECDDGYHCVDGNSTEPTCVRNKKTDASVSCDSVKCEEGNLCVQDKDSGVLCVPIDSCWFTVCPKGFDCEEDDSGKGVCMRRSCATLRCKYPYVCHTPKLGIPECILKRPGN